jgi:perosamine synthetase
VFTGRYLGTFGRFGCFSLSFHKLITTGQGGIIVSHTKEDYETIERWKDHGSIGEWFDKHDYFGFNFCYTDLQAVVGLSQLKSVKKRIQKKRNIFKWYFDVEPEPGYVPWFMEYYAENKEKCIAYLKKHGIMSRSFYPPIHSQKIYQNAYCPVTEVKSERGLWLPSSLTLTKDQVIYIKEVLKKYESL